LALALPVQSHRLRLYAPLLIFCSCYAAVRFRSLTAADPQPRPIAAQSTGTEAEDQDYQSWPTDSNPIASWLSIDKYNVIMQYVTLDKPIAWSNIPSMRCTL
jgi:hypothetical protein